jgi:hypothetical protein
MGGLFSRHRTSRSAAAAAAAPASEAGGAGEGPPATKMPAAPMHGGGSGQITAVAMAGSPWRVVSAAQQQSRVLVSLWPEARAERVLDGCHEGTITRLAYGASQMVVASAGRDGSLALRSVDMDTCVQFAPHSTAVTGLALSPGLFGCAVPPIILIPSFPP